MMGVSMTRGPERIIYIGVYFETIHPLLLSSSSIVLYILPICDIRDASMMWMHQEVSRRVIWGGCASNKINM